MNAQTYSASSSQSSLYLDLNTLKQRRFQYKVARRNGEETSADTGNDSFTNNSPTKIHSQGAYLSDRAHHVVPRMLTQGSMTPTNARNVRDQSIQDLQGSSKEQIHSEPSQPVTTIQSQNISSPLTPLKNSTLLTIDTVQQQSRQELESFESLGNETPRIQTLKHCPMSPEGKCYSEPNIFHKDLTSYRIARELAKSPGSTFSRSNSLKEESRGSSYDKTLERAKTIAESERKGHIIGLERFYNRHMEVPEEDEGHSDEGKDNSRDKLEIKASERRVSSGTVSLRNTKMKMNNMSGIISKGLDRSMEKPKKYGGTTPNSSSGRNGVKKDGKELIEQKTKAIAAAKKTEETSKQKLQRTFEEESAKVVMSQEDSNAKTKVFSSSMGQKSNLLKKMQLNNWTKPGIPDSATSSSRNSPKSRQKDILAAGGQSLKKPAAVDSPKSPIKKAVESKVARIFKKSPTVQLGSATNASSIGCTAILDDLEAVNNNVRTVADVTGSESKMWSTFRRASDLCNNIANSSNALNIKTRKPAQKVDVKQLKLPLGKEGNEISKIPLESETDREQKSSRERDSSLGKQGGTTRDSTNRKESLIKITNESVDQISTPMSNNNTAKKSYGGVKKSLNETIGSPYNKKIKEDNKDSHEKPKTPLTKAVKNGVAPTHSKNGAISGLSAFGGGSYAKMKSPLNKPVKGNDKIGENQRTLLSKSNGMQKGTRTPMNPRESRNSIDWRNLDDLKLPAGDRSVELERSILQFEAIKVEPVAEEQAPQEDVENKEEILSKDFEVTEQEIRTELIKTESSVDSVKSKQENKASQNLKVSPQLLKALGLPSLIKGKNM